MKKLCDSIVNFHYYSTDENRFVIKPQLWDNTGERERIYLSIYKAFKSNWFWRYKKHGWLYTKFGEMERKWMIKEQEPVSFPGTQQTLINARPGSRTSRSRTRTSSWSRAGTSSRCPSFPAEQRPRPGFNRGWRPGGRWTVSDISPGWARARAPGKVYSKKRGVLLTVMVTSCFFSRYLRLFIF